MTIARSEDINKDDTSFIFRKHFGTVLTEEIRRAKFCTEVFMMPKHLMTKLCFVCCGFTSHSAIFQLYSDGTVVQFPNFDLLPGTHAMGS